MSSAVKKSSGLRSSNQLQERSHSSGRAEATGLKNARQARIQALEPKSGKTEGSFSEGLINRLGSMLLTSLPGCNACIARVSPAADMIRVEWAVGSCEPLLQQVSDGSDEIFRSFLKSGAPMVVRESTRDRFPLCPPHTQGSFALCRVDLGAAGYLLISLFQPLSIGTISERSRKFLVSLAELAAMANLSDNSTRELVAHEVRMEALRAEINDLQAFYRRFSNTVHQCFWVLDLETQRVVTVSDNFEAIWGSSRRALTQGGLTGFMSSVFPEDRDRVLAEFHGKLNGDLSIETRVIDDQGELRWLWLRGSRSQSEGPQQLLLVADDVTEKKQAEELQRSREANLISNARNVAVGDLASGVAHEINNPLTIIVGRASELKKLLTLDSEQMDKAKDLVDKIQSTAIRISQIVLSLKALAKKEPSGTMIRHLISPMVTELKDLASARFRSHEVTLEFGDLRANAEIEMNPTLISQVVLNLMNNAFDAVQTQKEKWVKVDFTEDNDSIYVSITDSGSGIPIKNRGRIFDAFFTTKEPGKGTGLGLSLASSIAAHHHGSLRLDTLHPRTRFVLQLPKRQPV
jgi:PAS domain S-box-containing protein